MKLVLFVVLVIFSLTLLGIALAITSEKECKGTCILDYKSSIHECNDARKKAKTGCKGLKGREKREYMKIVVEASQECKENANIIKRECKENARNEKKECISVAKMLITTESQTKMTTALMFIIHDKKTLMQME